MEVQSCERFSCGRLLLLSIDAKHLFRFHVFPCFFYQWFCLLSVAPVEAQKNLAGETEIRQGTGPLNSLGSVMMIAATRTTKIRHFWPIFHAAVQHAHGLSFAHQGEGGQNLIGPEQGDELGIIRTQELLAGAASTEVNIFHPRKSTLVFRKRLRNINQVAARKGIGDIVWISAVRPDVIVLRFSGTPRDGHGHHQASGFWQEAFSVAADPAKFPDSYSGSRRGRPSADVQHRAFTADQEREAAKMKWPSGNRSGRIIRRSSDIRSARSRV